MNKVITLSHDQLIEALDLYLIRHDLYPDAGKYKECRISLNLNPGMQIESIGLTFIAK